MRKTYENEDHRKEIPPLCCLGDRPRGGHCGRCGLAGRQPRERRHGQAAEPCLQESTNRRLNILALLSAMYLPPTLIAGIYGMNLQGIPMTKLSHGYFIVIVFMAAVVLGHFWFFYRRGWFK